MINLKHIGSENDPLRDQFLISIDNMVGKGSYGKVYIAYNCEDYQSQNLSNPICAKEIPRALISDKIVKSIRNEAQIQMQSKSPRVLKMHSVKQTKSNVYFFLEYCPDGDLKQLIYNNNLTEQQIIYLFGQIAYALSELKDERVYHRDLKPENILIKDGCIKIADFGFSKVVIEFTKNNTQVGTPLYMSPQALFSSHYDLEKNDVWSAGCLLYEMVYKRLPWKVNLDTSVGGLYQIIMNSQIAFPKDMKVSEELKELINLMIEVEEEGRLDWDDIINKEIIRKSQLDNTVKAQIQQLAANYAQKQKDQMQDKQQQWNQQDELKTQKNTGEDQGNQIQKKVHQIQKANSNVEQENSDDNEDIFEQDNEYEQERVNRSQNDETPSLWRLIQMHRSVYKYIQMNFAQNQEKLYFLICLKYEEYSFCKKYITMVDKQKKKSIDSNILDQIQFFIQEIQKGNQYKELQVNLSQLIDMTKQKIVISKENSNSLLQSTFLKYKQKQLEEIKQKSEEQQRESLIFFSKLKFIAMNDYEYRGGYKILNFDDLPNNQLIAYIYA